MFKPSFVAMVVVCFSSCAAMHQVTGDPMFRPTEPTKQVVRGPNVPEPEPDDAHLQEAPKPVTAEDELAPLPLPASKQKQGKKVAAANPDAR